MMVKHIELGEEESLNAVIDATLMHIISSMQNVVLGQGFTFSISPKQSRINLEKHGPHVISYDISVTLYYNEITLCTLGVRNHLNGDLSPKSIKETITAHVLDEVSDRYTLVRIQPFTGKISETMDCVQSFIELRSEKNRVQTLNLSDEFRITSSGLTPGAAASEEDINLIKTIYHVAYEDMECMIFAPSRGWTTPHMGFRKQGNVYIKVTDDDSVLDRPALVEALSK